MEAEFHWEAWRQPLIFLLTAGVVVPLFRRLRVSPVLGFLIAGALLGPFGAGRLAQTYPWLGHVTIGGGAESMSRVGILSSGTAWPMDPSMAVPNFFMPQGVAAD